jgi:hypothetical protein
MTDNTFYLKPNNPSKPDDLKMAKQQLEVLGVTVFGPILENEELYIIPGRNIILASHDHS